MVDDSDESRKVIRESVAIPLECLQQDTGWHALESCKISINHDFFTAYSKHEFSNVFLLRNHAQADTRKLTKNLEV